MFECVYEREQETETNGQEENESEVDENIMRSGTVVTNPNPLGGDKHNLCVNGVCC